MATKTMKQSATLKHRAARPDWERLSVRAQFAAAMFEHGRIAAPSQADTEAAINVPTEEEL